MRETQKVLAQDVMRTSLPWVNELSSVIAASATQRPPGRCEIRFRVDQHTFGIDLASGTVTDGTLASSEIAGDEYTFGRIMSGQETLQSAYRGGAITLSGDPEPFLRLAMALDRLAATQVCLQ